MQDIKFLVPIVSNSKLKQMIADLQEKIEENCSEMRDSDDIRSDYNIATEDWEDGTTDDKEYYSTLGGLLTRTESTLEKESADGIYSGISYSSSGLHALDCRSHY